MDSFHDVSVPQIVTKGRHTSWLRMLLHVAGCLLFTPLYWAFAIHCRYPVTLDLILTILLTELNRLVNEGRRLQFYEEDPEPMMPPQDEKSDDGFYDEKKVGFTVTETQIVPQSRLDSMAAVVGWREDPALFTRALESYKSAMHCKFMLVGIDGDDVPDQDMVDVFNNVSHHGSYSETSNPTNTSEPARYIPPSQRLSMFLSLLERWQSSSLPSMFPSASKMANPST